MSRTDAEVTRAADQLARTVLRLLSERNAAVAERDRARDLVAALEAQLAAVEAICDTWERETGKLRALLNQVHP